MSTAVTIMDVATRDGFQIVTDWIPTDIKKKTLDGLVAAGVTQVEATSFVSPKAIPQLADAPEIAAYMRTTYPHVLTAVIAPNMRGVENAAAAGITDINYIISASEEHNKNNIRRTHAESFADLAAILTAFPAMRVTLALPTVFGCPFTGCVPLATTLDLVARGAALGIRSVTLADTIGVANPRQVTAVVGAVTRAFPDLALRLHMHDTHGMGLANMVAGLDAGVTIFETAAGGMGGCPFAPGAAGNTATEDAVNMFHRMGVPTGINLEAYLDVVAFLKKHIAVPLPGRFAVARSFAEFCFFDPAEQP